jgi:hypothetical protein
LGGWVWWGAGAEEEEEEEEEEADMQQQVQLQEQQQVQDEDEDNDEDDDDGELQQARQDERRQQEEKQRHCHEQLDPGPRADHNLPLVSRVEAVVREQGYSTVYLDRATALQPQPQPQPRSVVLHTSDPHGPRDQQLKRSAKSQRSNRNNVPKRRSKATKAWSPELEASLARKVGMSRTRDVPLVPLPVRARSPPASPRILEMSVASMQLEVEPREIWRPANEWQAFYEAKSRVREQAREAEQNELLKRQEQWRRQSKHYTFSQTQRPRCGTQRRGMTGNAPLVFDRLHTQAAERQQLQEKHKNDLRNRDRERCKTKKMKGDDLQEVLRRLCPEPTHQPRRQVQTAPRRVLFGGAGIHDRQPVYSPTKTMTIDGSSHSAEQVWERLEVDRERRCGPVGDRIRPENRVKPPRFTPHISKASKELAKRSRSAPRERIARASTPLQHNCGRYAETPNRRSSSPAIAIDRAPCRPGGFSDDVAKAVCLCAKWVTSHGGRFEPIIAAKYTDDPDFDFLRNVDSPAYRYYQEQLRYRRQQLETRLNRLQSPSRPPATAQQDASVAAEVAAWSTRLRGQTAGCFNRSPLRGKTKTPQRHGTPCKRPSGITCDWCSALFVMVREGKSNPSFGPQGAPLCTKCAHKYSVVWARLATNAVSPQLHERQQPGIPSFTATAAPTVHADDQTMLGGSRGKEQGLYHAWNAKSAEFEQIAAEVKTTLDPAAGAR